MKKQIKANKGFSLAEILLAISIFSIALTPLIQIFILSSQDAELASDYYHAHHLLVTEIEKMKSFSSLYPDSFRQIYTHTTTYNKTSGKFTFSVTVDPDFKYSMNASDGSARTAIMTEVTAEASWAASSGRTQALKFYTTLF